MDYTNFTVVTVASLNTLFAWRENYMCFQKRGIDVRVIAYDDSCRFWGQIPCINGGLNGGFHPKHLYYCNLAPYVSTKFVFFSDEDISFCDFDFDMYMRVWNLSRPAVSQPVINSNTQDYWIANSRSWRHEKLKHAVYLETMFVEQQVFMMKNEFAQWFWRTIGCEYARVQDDNKCDWGIDRLWCKAANVFYNTTKYECSVMKVAISHVNKKTINKTRMPISGCVGNSMFASRRFHSIFLPLNEKRKYQSFNLTFAVEHARSEMHSSDNH